MTVLRNLLATTLSLGLIGLGGCSSGTENVRVFWDATLQPVSPGRVTGTVAALAEAGRTRLTIQIRNAAPGETYGWRAESGTCDAPGGIQGGAALYPSITADPSGGGDADASVPGLFRSGSRYAVLVVRPATDGSGEVVVACGELSESE